MCVGGGGGGEGLCLFSSGVVETLNPKPETLNPKFGVSGFGLRIRFGLSVGSLTEGGSLGTLRKLRELYRGPMQ